MCDETGDGNKKGLSMDLPTDDKSHWVEKLFPPAFQFSLHDLVCPKTTPITENGSQEWDNINNTFEQLSRRILPEDIEAIKNVYHRVWLMMKNQQQHPVELTDQGMCPGPDFLLYKLLCQYGTHLINNNNNNFCVSNIRVSNRTLFNNVCPKSALT